MNNEIFYSVLFFHMVFFTLIANLPARDELSGALIATRGKCSRDRSSSNSDEDREPHTTSPSTHKCGGIEYKIYSS